MIILNTFYNDEYQYLMMEDKEKIYNKIQKNKEISIHYTTKHSISKQKADAFSPTPHRAVFVSRTKFPVFLPKASQGDSLAAFCGFNTRNFLFLRNCEAL